MAIQLSRDTELMLRRYVDSQISNAELADWLVGAEYDPALGPNEQDALARISLVVIEVDEERREPTVVLDSVAELLAASTPGDVIIASRTGSATLWQQEPELSAAPTRLQRVGI